MAEKGSRRIEFRDDHGRWPRHGAAVDGLIWINLPSPVALHIVSRHAHGDGRFMALHKRILEWQAAHPNRTWVFWIVVWAIAIMLIIWPRSSW